MYFKTALRNVKKSIRDYAVYFMTLTFGVCLFYVFNAIESQQAMMAVNEAQHFMLQNLTQIMGVTSVFISVILAALIIYANRFLIRRRKHELGIYMLLGMEKEGISFILIAETFIIGVFALTVGLLLGIFSSQGLSAVTAWMFEVPLKQFQFTFSAYAFTRSCIYFGVIFALVMVFNIVAVSKCKLIDLLTAHKKNEVLRVKSLRVSVLLFLLSALSLGAAYTLILKNGLLDINLEFGLSIALGIIGTFLFFLSLSGFLLRVVKSAERLYYRGLAMFVLRQINSKITTAFMSMSIICLMLFLTIGVLSTSMALNMTLRDSSQTLMPYDVSLRIFKVPDDLKDVTASIMVSDPGINAHVSDIAHLYVYDDGITMKEFIKGGVPDSWGDVVKLMGTEPVRIVSLSDYNKMRAMQGLDEMSIVEDQFIISSNVEDIYPIFDYFISEGAMLRGKYRAYPQIMSESYYIYPAPDNLVTIVLSDSQVQGMSTSSVYLNINYKNGEETDGPYVEAAVTAYLDQFQEEEGRPFYYFNSREEMLAQQVGMSVIVTYLGMYVGAVFLITSAAVLALQQLSEASDNIQRYRILRRMGTDKDMINKAIFAQIFIYFIMPLGLAVVHSVVGLKVANRVIVMFGKSSVLTGIIISATAIIIIYGGYMLATYWGSKIMAENR